MLRNSIHRAIRTDRKIETTRKTMENLARSRHVPRFQVSRVYTRLQLQERATELRDRRNRARNIYFAGARLAARFRLRLRALSA